MGVCEKCGVEIDDKYKYCFSCVQQMKEDNASVGAVKNSEDVVRELGKLNNNLYALRTIQEEILKDQLKKSLVWDKKKTKFVIKKFEVKKWDRQGKSSRKNGIISVQE